MSENQILNPVQLITMISNYLEEKHIQCNTRYEAELMVSEVLRSDRLGLYLQFDKPVNESEKKELRELLKKRVSGLPLPYILGYSYFYGNKYIVDQGVLIPRPDTEVLVDLASDTIKNQRKENLDKPSKILEIGTGTGIISMELGMRFKNLSITGLDIDECAVLNSEKNLNLYADKLMEGTTISFQRMNA